MRLFTGLDLPDDMLLRLERLLAILRPEASIKWSPVENLHITTKFIGEWPEHQLDRIDAVLKKVGLVEAVDIEMHDLGWFPNAHSPRVLWAGVHGGGALHDLAERTEEALSALGMAKEQHAFSPHLTLARIKGPAALQRLHAKVEEMQFTPIGNFRAEQFHLYSSEPGSNASLYRKLRTYSLHSS